MFRNCKFLLLIYSQNISESIQRLADKDRLKFTCSEMEFMNVIFSRVFWAKTRVFWYSVFVWFSTLWLWCVICNLKWKPVLSDILKKEIFLLRPSQIFSRTKWDTDIAIHGAYYITQTFIINFLINVFSESVNCLTERLLLHGNSECKPPSSGSLSKPGESGPVNSESAPKPSDSAPKPSESASKPNESAPKPSESSSKPSESAPKTPAILRKVGEKTPPGTKVAQIKVSEISFLYFFSYKDILILKKWS